MSVQYNPRQSVAPRSLLTTEVIRGSVAIVDRLAVEWRELCGEGTHNQPFYRPEWVAAYLRSFEPRANVVLITVRRGGRLRGVLPLIEEHLGVVGMRATRLRAPANEHSNRLHLIHGAGDGVIATEQIWRILANLPGWDILDFRDVPEHGAFHRLLAAANHDGFATATRETLRSPFIPLESVTDPDTSLDQLDARFKRNLRSGKRKLATLGPIRLQRHTRADPDIIDRFIEIEHANWKGRTGTAIASYPATRQFYAEVATAAANHGYLALYELWCGDQIVAIDLGLALDGRYFVPKTGNDEAFRAVGPGHLMIGETLRDLVDLKFSQFDMLGTNEPYKERWTSNYRQHYQFHVFAKGTVGRALQTWTERFLPTARRVRRRLHGLDGTGRSPAVFGAIGLNNQEPTRWS